jgi:hypothetical protein
MASVSGSLALQGRFEGWLMAWNVMMQSGPFFTPYFTGSDTGNTGPMGNNSFRPDVVSGAGRRAIDQQLVNPGGVQGPGLPRRNPPVHTNPASIGRFGDAGLGILRGPSIRNADLALSKYFTLHERVRLQFRANAVNVFNHPNLALPASNISAAATVAKITADVPATFGTVASREVDFQLGLEF